MTNRSRTLKRRELLKTGLGAGLTVGFPSFFANVLNRKLHAAPAMHRKKLLFIFQRGGNDGINTVIPRGDPEYNLTHRPTLFLPQSQALDSGNGFAQLHPQLAPLMGVYNSNALTGIPGLGNLALIHRVGYAGQSLSHFDSQRFWETGAPTQPQLQEGMLYRLVDETMDPRSNPLVAAALSSTQIQALQGPRPLSTLRRLDTFGFSGSAEQVDKLLGQQPPAPQAPGGSGLQGLYGGPYDFPNKPYREIVYQTGQVLIDTVSSIQAAQDLGPYVPSGGATYDFGGEFGQQLQTAAMLFKRTEARVLGVDLSEWDTHVAQGQNGGAHGRLLEKIARGFAALAQDLEEQWDDLLILTMTEFGRTSRENGSRGTDHAHACCVLAAGGAVRGGIYNCDATTWAPGDLFSESDRYLAYRTDYRAVFAEIFGRHFGDDPETVERIIPGYTAAAQAQPDKFEFLNFLPA